MRITQVMLSHGEGGLEKHTLELCNALSRAGHSVTLIGDASLAPQLDPAIDLLTTNTAPSRNNPLLLFSLYRKISASHPDIIHAQAHKAAAALSRLRFWLKAPLLASVHGVKRDNRALAKLDAVICVSQEVAKRANHPNGFVIYNGIAEPDTRHNWSRERLRSEFSLDPYYPTIGVVGRLAPVKGVDLALSAVDGLPLNMIVFGDGPERERLLAQHQQLRHPERIRFAGHRQDIGQILPALDAVLISSHREGFSYVLAEALLAGVAIISTDVAGPREILPPQCIVGPASLDNIRSGLQHWLHQPEQWRAAMSNAFDFAQQELTLEQMTRHTLSVYNQMLEAKH